MITIMIRRQRTIRGIDGFSIGLGYNDALYREKPPPLGVLLAPYRLVIMMMHA